MSSSFDGLNDNATSDLKVRAAHAARLALGEAANFYGAPVWWREGTGWRYRRSTCFELTISREGGTPLAEGLQNLRAEIIELRGILDQRGIDPEGDGPEALLAGMLRKARGPDPFEKEAREAHRLTAKALARFGEFDIRIADPDTGTGFKYAVVRRQPNSPFVLLTQLQNEKSKLSRLLHAANLERSLHLSHR